jgi:amino acid permease
MEEDNKYSKLINDEYGRLSSENNIQDSEDNSKNKQNDEKNLKSILKVNKNTYDQDTDMYLQLQDPPEKRFGIAEEILTRTEINENIIEKVYEDEMDTYDNNYRRVNIEIEENPEDKDDESESGNSTVMQAGIQVANTILGAGILGIPLVFKHMGILLTIFMIFLIVFINMVTVKYLLQAHVISGKGGFSIFSKICYGNTGNILVKIIIALNNFGLVCAYYRIFSDVMVTLVKVFFEVSDDNFFVANWHGWFWIVLLAFIMLYTIFMDDMDSLKFTSIIAIIGIFMIITGLFVTLIFKAQDGTLYPFESKMWIPHGDILEMFSVVPSIILAFSFQFGLFSIFYSLKKPNPTDMMKSCWIGIGFAGSVGLTVGLLSYIIYGETLEGWLLPSVLLDMSIFKKTNYGMYLVLIVICVGLIFVSMMSIPIVFFTYKKNVVNIVIILKKMWLKSHHDESVLKDTNVYDDKIKDKMTKDLVKLTKGDEKDNKKETRTSRKDEMFEKLDSKKIRSSSIDNKNLFIDINNNFNKNKKITKSHLYVPRKRKGTLFSRMTVQEQRKLEEKIEIKYLTKFSKNLIILLAYSLLIFLTTVIVDLSTIFNVVGAISSNSISFIIPPLIIMKFTDIFKLENKSLFWPKIIMVFGIIIMIVCLISEFIIIAKGKNHEN